jgi:hypothetical protein
MPVDFKGTVFLKKLYGGLFAGLERTFYIITFSVIFEKISLYVYGEYAKRRKRCQN